MGKFAPCCPVTTMASMGVKDRKIERLERLVAELEGVGRPECGGKLDPGGLAHSTGKLGKDEYEYEYE